MNLTDLQTFCLVADTGTISAAAARLGVPKSTVSRRVRRLEDAIGQELLRRSPRAVALTEQGVALQLRSAGALHELQAAVDALSDIPAQPSGTLRITTVPDLGQTQSFVHCLRDYALKYPHTTIELELTTRLVNLIEEGVDVGIRLHVGALSASPMLMSRRLLRFERAVYASPSYLQEAGTPMTPRDLAHHRVAAHSIVDTRAGQWTLDGKALDTDAHLPSPRWRVNDSATLERFALSGAGIAFLPTVAGDSLVQSGALVRVLPRYLRNEATATLIWPSSRHLAPRVRAFIDHAVQTLGTHP